ncbi:outer membrane protein assembly factor BamB family protein [Lacihabitans soyangensis]|uniref:Pyrrolo-quinoline quinone repeat domain-containing protein n=1 Tax=Lacihabitans soyangensis TaxID=869394 RepID=A0AAE3KXI2_9BACT|nr:PQQ-binding-like beta-propeller repeat protein [Lacihabitans soyangensis]MCP9765040.1 hypothetical protein [Lacihabitans soyangensis]
MTSKRIFQINTVISATLILFLGCKRSISDINPIENLAKSKFTFELKENGVVEFKNQSENTLRYEWSFSDNQTSTEKNPKISFKQNGNCSSKLIAFNQFSKDSTQVDIKVSNVSVEKIDYVFVCDDESNCSLIDAKSGNIISKTELPVNPGSGMDGSPTYSNGMILVPANNYPNGKLIALDIINGKSQWEFTTKRGIRSTPIVKDNKVFFTSSNWGGSSAILYCIESSTGQIVWENELIFAGDSSPTIKDNSIFIGSVDGIYIIDVLTGKYSNTKFNGFRPKSVSAASSYDSSPCVNGTEVYHCQNRNFTNEPFSQIFTYDTQSKKSNKLFELSPRTMSSPTYIDQSLIINNQTSLVIFDINKKNFKWVFKFPVNTNKSRPFPFSFDSSPKVNQNSIYAVGNGKLFSIDLLTGKENWRYGEEIIT